MGRTGRGYARGHAPPVARPRRSARWCPPAPPLPAGALEVQTAARSEELPAARLAELPQTEVAVEEQATPARACARRRCLAAGVPAGVDVEVVGADGYKQTVNAATVGRDDVIVAPRPCRPARRRCGWWCPTRRGCRSGR